MPGTKVPDYWKCRRRLARAMWELPLLYPDLCETLIPHLAEELSYELKPDYKAPPIKRTQRQLRAVESSAKALADALASLQSPALDALAFPVYRVESLIGELHEAAARAEKAVQGLAGRRRESKADRIAIAAAITYQQLTGAPPGLKQGFRTFLAAIFAALGVKASADSCAKKAKAAAARTKIVESIAP